MRATQLKASRTISTYCFDLFEPDGCKNPSGFFVVTPFFVRLRQIFFFTALFHMAAVLVDKKYLRKKNGIIPRKDPSIFLDLA
jgi:hypothetical protein